MPTTQYLVYQDGNLLYTISAVNMSVVDLGTYSIWVLDAPDAATAAVIRQDPGVTLQTSSDPLPDGTPPTPTDGYYLWSVVEGNDQFAWITSKTVDAQSTPGSLYFYDDLTLIAIVPQPASVAMIRSDCYVISAL
jgi:hypothetical protein